MVNVSEKVIGKLLVTFSRATNRSNVSTEGESKWEELSIGLTAKVAVDIEVVCENTSTTAVFFDNLEVKVQAVATVLVVQENHYYPFGLGMKGLDWTLQGQKEDKYSFQSKEKQTDLDLNISDFEARGYDYQINRTWQIDPHAESYYSSSPYSFLNNNPLNYIDPTGMDGESILGSGTAYDQQKAKDDEDREKRGKNNYTVNMYMFVWEPEQSGSGVGHASFTLPMLDENGNSKRNEEGEELYNYYSYYPDGSGGGHKAEGVTF